jgi:mono/diheme cytochrome c family protein
MKSAVSLSVVLAFVLGAAVSNPSSIQGAEDAASNYSKLCASCHGASGKGNGPAATALNPKPTDFADCKSMTPISDETLFKAIKGGGQTPMMPSWGGSLTDQQIKDLVTYIRGFCKM